MVGKTGFEPATSWSQTMCTAKLCYFPIIYGAPEGIRTPDLLVRSQTLYPAELRSHNRTVIIVLDGLIFVNAFFKIFSWVSIPLQRVPCFLSASRFLGLLFLLLLAMRLGPYFIGKRGSSW